MEVLKTGFSLDFDRFFAGIRTVPYQAGGTDLGGFDCWGLVEIWFKHWFRKTLIERQSGQSQPAEMLRQYHRFRKECVRLNKPENHCIVIMYDEESRVPREGHCGIYFNSNVLHMERGLGLCNSGFSHPSIQRRLAGLYRHPASQVS